MALRPVLIGQWLSRRHYARRSSPGNELTDRVSIGRLLSEREASAARDDGVAAVIDLTCEFTTPASFRDLQHLALPVLHPTAPPPAAVDAALAFINQHAAHGVVYVRCKAGYSRTAAVAGRPKVNHFTGGGKPRNRIGSPWMAGFIGSTATLLKSIRH